MLKDNGDGAGKRTTAPKKRKGALEASWRGAGGGGEGAFFHFFLQKKKKLLCLVCLTV
jgi:hypothetical protein